MERGQGKEERGQEISKGDRVKKKGTGDMERG